MSQLRFHRLLQQDVWKVIDHYERASGNPLADEFYAEFMAFAHLAAENPGRFHIDPSGLRRCNMRRFPYHFLYRVRTDDIFILVLRHDSRHPTYGLSRN